jgi:hypothetical protein
MSVMVSARVPQEIYDQCAEKLGSINSSVTELVNSAFSYLLVAGELPKASTRAMRGAALDDDLLADLHAKLEASALSVSLPQGWDYRDGLEAKVDDELKTKAVRTL